MTLGICEGISGGNGASAESCGRCWRSSGSAKTRTGVSDPNHVTKLAARLDQEGDLDPILVLPISYKRLVIIDGFHRLAEYKRILRLNVPAVVFTETPSEAKLIAVRENAKVKKELTSQEKTGYLLSLIVHRPKDDNGKPWTLAMCAQAADRFPRLAETISAYVGKCRGRGLEIPDKWRGGNWNLGDTTEDKVSQRVKDTGEQLKAVLGKLDTPGKLKHAAKSIQYATENGGKLATAIVQESGDFEALDSDSEERIAGEREESIDEAREEWQKETGSAVEAARAQVAAVTRQMADRRLHGSITNLIFGAARDAGSLRAYREALGVA